MRGLFKYPKKSSEDNDKRCMDFLINNYGCSKEDAEKRTESIKEICVDVMNKLLVANLKIETKGDLINLIKQYNTISNTKIIEYLEKEFDKN